MLTLQDILGSDSFATAIQKINENFKNLALAGGGPQGIRGEQGIPGLPGKQGSTGPIGPAGNNGVSVDIIPFDLHTEGYTGPTTGPAVGQVEWSVTSLEWVQANYGDTGGSKTPTPGMVVIDHANFGYWQYINGVQSPTPVNGVNPLSPGASDDNALVGNGYYVNDSYTGPGWYYYPSNVSNLINSLGDVWVNDFTTYLTGTSSGYNFPARGGGNSGTPYTVPKARLKSKFGVIWVSSHNSMYATPEFNSPLTVDQSPYIKDVFFGNEGERSAGVDRLLFKFSLDGRTITENVMSQAFTGPTDASNGFDINNGPYGSPSVLTPWENSYIKPLYGKSLFNYSPLVFLSPWSAEDDETNNNPTGVRQGNLGIFGYQSAINPENTDQTPVQLWVTSHRKEDAPNNATGPVYPTSRNLGEHLIDSRRTITSNQYAVLPSQDTAPIDERTVADTDGDTFTSYLESEDGPYVYQGYHSLMNGSFVNNDYFVKTYILDNVTQNASGPWVADADTWYNNNIAYPSTYSNNGRFHISLYKRASWFGSSVHVNKPSETDGIINEYVRSAGMMERDRSYTWIDGEDTNVERGNELIFYTAYTDPRLLQDVYETTGLDNNALSSKVVFYASPSRNFGITTVPRADVGIVEPHTRFHVHSTRGLSNERPGKIWGDVINNSHTRETDYFNLVAAFTSEAIPDFDKPSQYTVVKIGEAYTPSNQSEANVFSDFVSIPQGGIRFETYNNPTGLSHGDYTGSLQFGIGLGKDNPLYEISENNENFLNEWVLSVSPVSTGGNLGSGNDHSDRNKYIAGVGIQERFAKTRFHMYGQNTYRMNYDPEGVYGRYTITPGDIPTGNTPAHRQISLDYVNDSWQVSAGLLDYSYDQQTNTVNYPFTEGFKPKSLYGSGSQPSYDTWKTLLGPATSNDGNLKINGTYFPWPGSTTYPDGVGTSTHGGQFNAMFDVNHYQGFNLIRDLSFDGDDKDITTWKTGTDGNTNGATVFLTDKNGNFGISSIPSFRDGGVAAGRYEQTNIGNREVLNSMKFFFDTAGNLGISSKPGFDPNAYPARYKDSLNNVYYLSGTVGTGPYPNIVIYTGPSTSRLPGAGSSPHSWGGQIPGQVAPYNYPGLVGPYDRAWIASSTTESEVIRTEIAAEKLFSAPGRIMQNRGWGYPIGKTIPTTYISLKYTLWDSSTNDSYSGTLLAATDNEGRITNIFFTIVDGAAMLSLGGGSSWTADRILIQHPTEIVSYTAPIGAVSPSIDSITFIPNGDKDITTTVDWSELNDGILHSANVRLNNFVAGEGWGSLGTSTNNTPSGYTKGSALAADTTGTKAQQIRRTSPKIILTYEGIDDKRLNSTPIKVSTVIRSAQNTSSLREYWIPKSDNTGGTFMTFTSHFETGANDDSIDRSSIAKERLQIEDITYVAIDYNYGGNCGSGIGSGDKGNLFHPTYVKYQYSPITAPTVGVTPDEITWPTSGVGYDWVNPYGNFYDNTTDIYDPITAPWGVKPFLNPLRQRTDPSGPTNSNTFGYKYAVEIDKSEVSLRENPTQIRFRRINSEFAMMDFNITLKVNDQWDLELDDPDDNTEPNPTTYAAGTFASSVQRRGLWWLQHVRIRFDIDSGMVKATPTLLGADTPNYHATKYDNGMGFRMWSDYNQWYSGNAVAHRGVTDAIGYSGSSNAYDVPTFQGFQRTFNHNVWNWPSMMSDYLNSNSRVIPTSLYDSGLISIPASASTRYYSEALGTVTTVITDNPYASYDRLIYIDLDDDTNANTGVNVTCTDQNGNVVTLLTLNNGPTFRNGTAIIPAGSSFRITLIGFDTTGGQIKVHTFQMGSTFPLDYHNRVGNTGTVLGLTPNSGALMPFVQALRNRTYSAGSWNDIYDEGDGMWGPTYINIDRLMRQVWTTFGNGAFMKSKPLQWRVFPYNDPGTRGAGYEWEEGDTTTQLLPKGTLAAGGSQGSDVNGGFENSFYLDVIIPDGILHDPVGGFGAWKENTAGSNKDTPNKVSAGFTNSRDYRYVTISGQAMVNFQDETKGTAYNPVPPEEPKG